MSNNDHGTPPRKRRPAEPSAPSVPQGTDSASEQLSLFPPAQRIPTGAHAGLQRAIDAADPWDLDGGIRCIESLAVQRGVPINADVLRGLRGDPETPSTMGAVFRVAAALGIIEAVAAAPSTRAERRGGLRREWRAAPGFLASLEADGEDQ